MDFCNFGFHYPEMTRKGLLYFLILFGIVVFADCFAQENVRELRIRKTTQEISIDGVLDEAAWGEADRARDFFPEVSF